MRYLDTSVLIASFVIEAATDRVQAWFRDNDQPLAISDWSIAEFASGLAKKSRMEVVDPSERNEAELGFAAFCEESAAILTVSRASFRRAAELVRSSEHPLRSPDALHLAIAAEQGATLVTLDGVQGKAGFAVGIDTQML